VNIPKSCFGLRVASHSLRPVPAPTPSHPEARRGALAATACYLLWGIVPLYWKQLAAIDAVELIAHRHIWSLLVLLLAMSWQGGFGAIAVVLRSPRGVLLHLLSAALLTTNWLVYVHAVNTGRVIECSLGYFLVPLVNVLVGRFVLHERMRGLQWAAVGCAAIGVGLLVGTFGEVPLVALALAASWGAYSLMRKRSVLPALPALSVETMLLLPLAIGWLLHCEQQGRGALGHVDARMHLLLLSSGIVTALPLVLFAYGAQRIRLSTLGLLQYVSPSVQLLLGVAVYGESFSTARAISFGWIWAGLGLYTADGVVQQRRRGAP
jgi:chloramphenicol-sensitive protein RarD